MHLYNRRAEMRDMDERSGRGESRERERERAPQCTSAVAQSQRPECSIYDIECLQARVPGLK